MESLKPKVSIIGAGNVGSTFAFSLMISGLAREIVLIDKDERRAQGECMDLNHGAAMVPPVKIYAAGYEGCKNSDIIVLTAGAKQKPGESRLALLQRNVEVFKAVITEIQKYETDSILLVVTNPVDILSYVTLKLSGLSPSKVIGSGTVLDSSRLRYLLSEHCQVDARNVHAYIIGEHGDTELAVWSQATIGGIRLNDYCPSCLKNGCNYMQDLEKIFNEVKNAAYKIIEAKGATYYAIGLSIVKIVASILRNENSILPISTLINDYYGINDVYLSIPSIVNKNGVEMVLKLRLSEEEAQKLKSSANQLKDVVCQLHL